MDGQGMFECPFCGTTNNLADWHDHGIGECVPVCLACDGSGVDKGVAPPASVIQLMRSKILTAVDQAVFARQSEWTRWGILIDRAKLVAILRAEVQRIVRPTDDDRDVFAAAQLVHGTVPGSAEWETRFIAAARLVARYILGAVKP